MRSIDIKKRQQRRLVGEFTGQNLDTSRPWMSQSRAAGFVADLFALPIMPENVIDLNDADGNLIFVPGISVPGGPDVLVP